MTKFFNIHDNNGYLEAEFPFHYSNDNNVIGWLYDEDHNCICMTTIPESLLITH